MDREDGAGCVAPLTPLLNGEQSRSAENASGPVDDAVLEDGKRGFETKGPGAETCHECEGEIHGAGADAKRLRLPAPSCEHGTSHDVGTAGR